MNSFMAAIVIGTMTLGSAQSAVAQTKPSAQQTVPIAAAGASAHPAARDASADRQSFAQKARDEVQAWQRTLTEFNAKLVAKATASQAKASKRLDAAWTDTKAAADRLETAGEKDWDKAHASFKTASHKLALAWQKVNPGAKS